MASTTQLRLHSQAARLVGDVRQREDTGGPWTGLSPSLAAHSWALVPAGSHLHAPSDYNAPVEGGFQICP